MSDAIGRLKGQCVGKVIKKFKWFDDVCWKENMAWSSGHVVFTMRLKEDEIINYGKRKGRIKFKR